MIIGGRDMLVIDPQFSLSEAHKLAAEILETKSSPSSVSTGVAVFSTAAGDAELMPRHGRGP